MSTTTEDDPQPLAESAAASEPKPARRRRAPTAAAPAEGDATADAPAPKPRRRKPVVAEAAAEGEGATPAPAAAPEAAAAVAVATPLTDAPAPAAEPLAAPVPAPTASAPADAAAPGTDGAEPEAGDGDETGAAAAGDEGRRERRRKRRDRRDRREGERPVSEAAAPEGDEAAEGDETAAPVPNLPPENVADRFADVVSGAFDTTAEAPADAAPPKRVLPPEPESPKLHKVLAQAGIGSRREMEEMILEGRITVNGQPAHIGQRISFGDQIKIGGKPIKVRILPPPPRIVAYHKPAGEIVTHDDPQNRPTVFRRLPRLARGKWQSVGRLDINTEGLLLFTNSGELANQLMHPRFGVEREYAVRVLGSLDEDSRADLVEGVDIDGQTASFKSIEDGGGDGANRWYRVVITEGRNREVRKLFDAVGLTVNRLIRIRYGTVVLPRGLKRGQWVDLGDDDVRAIRRLAQPPQQQGQGAGQGQGNRNDRRGNKQRNRNERGRGPRPDAGPQLQREERFEDRPPREHDDDLEDDLRGPIPNPLEQTFDKRFVQKPRHRIGGGFGPGGSAPPGGGGGGGGGGNKPGKGPRQPDPMQTSVGYIGADAFHRKRNRGGSGGGGGGRGGFGGFGGGGR